MGDSDARTVNLVRFYKKIVEDPNIPKGNRDKANDAIGRCIEELRRLLLLGPLTEVVH